MLKKIYKKDGNIIIINDNLINVDYNPNHAFEKISYKSNIFIENSFKLAFEIIKSKRVILA